MIFGGGANIKCFKHVPVIIQPCKEIKELDYYKKKFVLIMFLNFNNLKKMFCKYCWPIFRQ